MVESNQTVERAKDAEKQTYIEPEILPIEHERIHPRIKLRGNNQAGKNREQLIKTHTK